MAASAAAALYDDSADTQKQEALTQAVDAAELKLALSGYYGKAAQGDALWDNAAPQALPELGMGLVHLTFGVVIPSLREQYMGRTPGKNSSTGQKVIDRMKSEGLVRYTEDSIEVYHPDTGWVDITMTDMGHKVDAVKWWNETGRFYVFSIS